jgi:Cof subfamily protein (haloacid dehalogenase superfamily)
VVATDLDGTLLDPSARLGDRTLAALQAARDRGLIVIPVTARPPHALWPVLRDAAVGPFGVCCNGAVIVEVTSRSVLEVERMPPDQTAGLVAQLRAAVPGLLLASDELAGFVHEPGFFDTHHGWEEELTEVTDVTAVIGSGCIKLVARRPGWTARDLLATVASAIDAGVTMTTAGSDWVDFSAAGVTKAQALARVCDRLGVAARDVVAVGDHHNDLACLAWAGTAMAPANAIPEVLAAAQRVLPSNEDEGVAVLLEELAVARGAWSPTARS